tara:strand:- start:1218 stop:1511 length:294 start_codon:yes stop_codon:yes gene_type:complete
MNLYIVTIAILSVILIVSLFYNYKFARIILNMEDAIEISLDRLDERHKSIRKILDTPLFFDSPQVRQVLSDIETSQGAILYVANQLAGIDNGQEKED